MGNGQIFRRLDRNLPGMGLPVLLFLFERMLGTPGTTEIILAFEYYSTASVGRC